MDDFKKIEKIDRKMEKILQKLEHISKEIKDLNNKSMKKPLRKKQRWHLNKLFKVQAFYCSEIHRLSVEKLSIKCVLEGGYDSETNPIPKENIL